MLEKNKNNQLDENEEQKDFEARQNLFGFFNLLLEEDMKQNPHLYKKSKNNENNRNTNNPN